MPALSRSAYPERPRGIAITAAVHEMPGLIGQRAAGGNNLSRRDPIRVEMCREKSELHWSSTSIRMTRARVPMMFAGGPRRIYICKIPEFGGGIKADWTGVIDHEKEEEFNSVLELQLGKMFGPDRGLYVESLMGLDSDSYDRGLGAGQRIMY